MGEDRRAVQEEEGQGCEGLPAEQANPDATGTVTYMGLMYKASTISTWIPPLLLMYRQFPTTSVCMMAQVTWLVLRRAQETAFTSDMMLLGCR